MYKPCISQYLQTFNQENGKTLIFSKLTKRTYSLAKNEYKVLQNLDGTKTLKDISILCEGFSSNDIPYLIDEFEKIGFIKNKEKKKKFDILKIKKGLINSDKIINPNNLLIKIIYFFIVYLSIPIFMIALLVGINFFDFVFIIKSIEAPNYFIVAFIIFFSISLHELSHAIVAKSNGAFIAEFGIMLYWFMPCGYTTIIGVNNIKSKSKRLLIFCAGIMVNLNLAGLLAILMKFSEENFNQYLVWFILVNIVLAFSNLLIFLKLDGYYILQELLCEKSLREKSFSHIKFLINKKTKINNISNMYKNEFLASLNNEVYLIYGILSIVYIPLTLIGVVFNIIPLFIK
ncbi:M50 family metallopeptidase [Clostridium gasigenes]|uniref:metalloprotease n=1 Tax=Clostridium gasigenes TaxID=94869 RepID=UPI001C0DE893|nr:M50 family metallopeptidase [Clostridium gasigenes]MBU3134522.1 M50 family metallopeptidase [Clostridium gasigenes]